MNTVNLIGRFGKENELRYTATGKAVLSNTLAVSSNYGEGTNWIDVTIWGKPGEATAKYTKKGSLVGVTGELKQESWEKEGQKRSKIIVNVAKIEFLDSKKDKGKEDLDDFSDLDDDFELVDDNSIPF